MKLLQKALCIGLLSSSLSLMAGESEVLQAVDAATKH